MKDSDFSSSAHAACVGRDCSSGLHFRSDFLRNAFFKCNPVTSLMIKSETSGKVLQVERVFSWN